MGIEQAKLVLDKALQRCQEYEWKDWSMEEVQELIIKTKIALNEDD